MIGQPGEWRNDNPTNDPARRESITTAHIPSGKITRAQISQDALKRPLTGRTAPISEIVTIVTGSLIVGLSWLFGLTIEGVICIALGSVLSVYGVVIGVTRQTYERISRHCELIVNVLDRHERDRVAEYGALMRKVDFVKGHADNLIGQTMQRVDDMGERVEQVWVSCDAAEARRNVERTDQLSALSEMIAAELLAINGATNGLRAVVETALESRTSTDDLHRTASALGISVVDVLIRHKSGEIYGPKPRTEDQAEDAIISTSRHLPYCETVNNPLASEADCTCTTPAESDGCDGDVPA